MTPEERADIEAADLHFLQPDAQHNPDVWTLNRWRVQLLGALVEAEADRDRAREIAVALEQENARARAVHESEQYIDDAWPHCLECTKDNADVVPWPCPTVRALDGGEAL